MEWTARHGVRFVVRVRSGIIPATFSEQWQALRAAETRDRDAGNCAVDVAKSMLNAATSWITTDIGPEAGMTPHPLLRSAGVSAFQLPQDQPDDPVPVDSLSTLHELPDALQGAASGVHLGENENELHGSQQLGPSQASLQRNMSAAMMHSRKESMGRSTEQGQSDTQPSGFAAAIETVCSYMLPSFSCALCHSKTYCTCDFAGFNLAFSFQV